MDDCAALLRLAAEAAGTTTLHFGARSADPFATPERLTVPRRSSATPASICWPRSTARRGDRQRAGRRRPPAPASASQPTTPGPTCSAACWSRRSSPRLGNGRATLLTEYPAAQAALARRKRGRSARRRALRALCLRRGAGQRLRRADRPGRAAPPLRGRDGREAAHLRRALSDRRGFPGRAGAHAAGQRRRARLRPAGHAGDRRHPHRAGALDAGGGTGHARRMRSDRCAAHDVSRHRHARSRRSAARDQCETCDRADAGLSRRRLPALERVAARYAVAITPDDGGADRSGRSAPTRSRASSCPTRPSWSHGRRSAPTRSATRRISPVPGIVHRYPDRVLLKLDARLPGLLPLLLPARGRRPRRPARAVRRQRSTRRSPTSPPRPAIWEVILTGGDPFMLSPRRIAERDARGSARIPHVKVLRWHTRVPVVDPGARHRRPGRRAASRGQGGLRGAARQPCARADRGARGPPAPASSTPASPCSARPCCSRASTTMPRRWPTLMRAFVESAHQALLPAPSSISRRAPATSAPRSPRARR